MCDEMKGPKIVDRFGCNEFIFVVLYGQNLSQFALRISGFVLFWNSISNCKTIINPLFAFKRNRYE